MPTKYHELVSTKQTPQNEAIPFSQQVKNSAGGYAWAVDDWACLDRFLIIGSADGSYYAGPRKLTKENAEVVLRCAESSINNAQRTIERIVTVSKGGLAAKNDHALFALALCSASNDEFVSKIALRALPEVARTGVHLFTFVEYATAFRGWGRAFRTAIANWYSSKSVDNLAYQLVKYRQRGGWSHRDLLRLAHPEPSHKGQDSLYGWVVGKEKEDGYTPKLLLGYKYIQTTQDAKQAAGFIRHYGLPREAVPTEFLKSAEVWEALLDDMPMTALIRNLGNLGKCGLLVPGNTTVINSVKHQLTDAERLRKARVHPINILVANAAYSQGRGVRGHGEWPVVPQIVDALDDAFYMAFKNIEPSGKRILVGLDVSGSMTQEMPSMANMEVRMAATAMAMATVRSEENYTLMAFTDRFIPLSITAKTSLNDAINSTRNLPFGRTDCSLPMGWALENGFDFDAFVIYTDSETWYGNIHPTQALQKYRRATGIHAKLVVVGMIANEFSIADPDDAGMLDVVGFDSSAPKVISDFIAGRI